MNTRFIRNTRRAEGNTDKKERQKYDITNRTRKNPRRGHGRVKNKIKNETSKNESSDLSQDICAPAENNMTVKIREKLLLLYIFYFGLRLHSRTNG